jgi:hypothetical protein
MNAFRTTLLSSIAVVAMAATAHAQTANSNSNSSSGSNSASGSSSRATSSSGGNRVGNQSQTQGTSTTTNTGVTLNQSSTSPASTSANNRDTVAGGTTNSNSNTGFTSSDNTVRAAPTVYAPPVSGGSPCSLGYSAGASFLGWGAAAGGQVIDAECQRRMTIAMLYNAGWKETAKEIACNEKETYYAFRAVGQPCVVRPEWEPKGAAPQPMVQQQPTPVPLGPQRVTSTQTPAFQPSGRFACMNAMGREVPSGTPGASCGYI